MSLATHRRPKLSQHHSDRRLNTRPGQLVALEVELDDGGLPADTQGELRIHTDAEPALDPSAARRRHRINLALRQELQIAIGCFGIQAPLQRMALGVDHGVERRLRQLALLLEVDDGVPHRLPEVDGRIVRGRGA